MAWQNDLSFITVDAHCDSLILREVREDPLDLAVADPAYHVDLPRMREGGMDAVWVMVGDNNLLQSLRLIDAVHGMAAAHPDDFAVCTTAAQVREARARGQVALLLSIEGQTMFAERVENVRNWHRLGVRMFSLTHGGGKFGSSPHALQYDGAFFGYLTASERATLHRQQKGLTPFARQAIAEVGRLGGIIDLAHCTDTSFFQTLEIAGGPVCFSHGCCYTLCPHARNLTDDMMRALAQHGGVLGICCWGVFIDQQTPTLERLCDHIVHALSVMGPKHVGIGTDFDGVDLRHTCVIEDAAGLPRLWEALAQRGVGDDELRKLAGGNMLRLMPA